VGNFGCTSVGSQVFEVELPAVEGGTGSGDPGSGGDTSGSLQPAKATTMMHKKRTQGSMRESEVNGKRLKNRADKY
tara:strand:+ start:188 stop:415 length:228 start_codon:yes stop_codon:yes gene_type:complete